MRNFHQNLLILLALALCLLCAYQWRVEVKLRDRLDNLNRLVSQKAGSIQEYTNSIQAMQLQISRMDARISELETTLATNHATVLSQQRELQRLREDAATLTNQTAQYRRSLDTLKTQLKEAYTGVTRQNDALKQLTTQRDDFVKRYNDSVTERNALAAKYNDLVAKMERFQSAPAKP